VSHHYKNPTQRVCLVQRGHHHIYLWTSLKQQFTGRYDDDRFVLEKHAGLDSYSAGSLKQQSTGRYGDGRFVLDKHAGLDSYSAGSLKQQSTGRYDDVLFVLDNTLKRPSPDSPQDLAATLKQETKQTRRRNSVGDQESNSVCCLVQRGHHHIFLWTVVSVS
jgi:23S rRNA A2030 N6-methylase RlmJ